AQQHLSAVIVVQRLAEFAYDLRPAPAHPCTPSQTDPVLNPDGSTTQMFVNEDCSRATVIAYPNGSFRTVLRYPDGFEESVRADTSDYLFPPDGCAQRWDYQHTLSTGDRSTYTSRIQWDAPFPGL